MKKFETVFVIVLCAVFIFSVGFMDGKKAALDKFVSGYQPTKSYQKSFEAWKDKFGDSTESIFAFRLAIQDMIINQHAKIINNKADIKDMNELKVAMDDMKNDVNEILTRAVESGLKF
ncbi:MAG: hypothetical protein PHQ00_00060 [Phycisphaerae bacterium]|nr:hypothetical protein [Phycisphaerae bacterium]